MYDGVIFISIDDNEQENLKKICDEIFGAGSFVDCITWNTRVPKNDNKGLGNIHQFILVYIKSSSINRQFTMQKDGLDDVFELLDNNAITEEDYKSFINIKNKRNTFVHEMFQKVAEGITGDEVDVLLK